jgi:hypothetical protein
MIILLVPAILGEARRKCLGDSRTIEDRTREIAHPLPLGHRCYRAMSRTSRVLPIASFPTFV